MVAEWGHIDMVGTNRGGRGGGEREGRDGGDSDRGRERRRVRRGLVFGIDGAHQAGHWFVVMSMSRAKKNEVLRRQ